MEPRPPPMVPTSVPGKKGKDPGAKNWRNVHDIGPMFHMTTDMLLELAQRNQVAVPAVGTGAGGKVIKVDIINAIRTALYGVDELGNPQKEKVKARAGGKPASRREPLHFAVCGATLAPGTINEYIGTALPPTCLMSHGFDPDTKSRAEFGDPERLWNTVYGFTQRPAPAQGAKHAPRGASISVWYNTSTMGSKDTLIIQDLGTDPHVKRLWEIAHRKRPTSPSWADSNAHVELVSPTVKALFVCQASNGANFGCVVIQGEWNIGLETLGRLIKSRFAKNATGERNVKMLLTYAVDRVKFIARSTSAAGRDTQHYGWKLETDPAGKEWLSMCLLPLPYMFADDTSGYSDVPTAQFVDRAYNGDGTMFLTQFVM